MTAALDPRVLRERAKFLTNLAEHIEEAQRTGVLEGLNGNNASALLVEIPTPPSESRIVFVRNNKPIKGDKRLEATINSMPAGARRIVQYFETHASATISQLGGELGLANKSIGNYLGRLNKLGLFTKEQVSPV